MQNRVSNRLRFKLYALIIPIVIAVVVVSGVFTSLESQKAIIEATNRHMAYKAEQLRDFAYSEWGVVERMNLANQAEYRTAMEKAFLSYAYSLLRTDTEQIMVFNSEGILLHRSSMQLQPDIPASGIGQLHETSLPTGWYSGSLAGEQRVGVIFAFEPFGWTVAITELRSQFFSAVRRVILVHLMILLGSLLVVSLFIAGYVRAAIRPTENLADTIERIAETHSLSHRALVENDDEIGFIADRFNKMISMLEVIQDQVRRTSLAETVSRNKAIQSEIETLYLLGKLSDYRDHETGEHQERISSMSVLFSRLLGQNEERQGIIKNSSRLHDIGKIAIPDSILLKPGKLTEAEFETIKSHTVFGYELLLNSDSENLAEGAVIAYTHHERWDGKGYPRGISGEDIPLPGRIVSVVDVFDALTSTRSYKTKWTNEDALAYIVDQRGRQFDPDLVDLFEVHFSEFAALLDV